MLEINVEETHDNLISLLDKVVQDNEIIIKRHGKKVARLISEDKNLSLPSLASFRASIQIKGKPMSQTVIELRDKERY
ncbi:type II toxin-antitoxin system Phd/YefM family antitoxin [Desulfobacterales bacterium HSG2]|nr:type II toxin-antitoxin system Phd/YefM family antitoxin [Desulfobacterales bacterium HSG2]